MLVDRGAFLFGKHVVETIPFGGGQPTRIALIVDLMRRSGEDHAQSGYVLAHVDLDHHAEVRKDHEQVDIVVRVTRVGTSSIELEHEIKLPDGRLAASGKSVLVAWDLATRAKRELSSDERAALA